MRDGTPSVTARRVAAYRLGAERVETAFGDPGADLRLCEDVAAGVHVEPTEPIGRYLRGRTSFFDRVVVSGLQRHVPQVLLIGAGYDGRALRYATEECHWFEVDHPSTQDDKRDRLARLGIDDGAITFVGADLRDRGLDAVLVGAGFQPDAPALMLCEGVTAYLEPQVVAQLLAELRSLVAPGTRLALSSSIARDAAGQAARERFAERVARVGEPVRSALSADDMEGMLGTTRWTRAKLSERASRLGFVVATPVWAPATPPAPSSAGRVAGYMEATFHRAGDDALAAHLATTHGVEVQRLRRLDVGVHRVEMADERCWIARVFPGSRPLEAAQAEARILRWLAERGFPAERLAAEEAVSVHEGQAVVVTECVVGKAPGADRAAELGELLGRLQSLAPPPGVPAGGAWHHLALGGPSDEIDALLTLLDDASPRVGRHGRRAYEALRATVAETCLAATEACSDLPQALIHPDFVPSNAIVADDDGEVRIVDWAGAGTGPRLWSLAFLLWALGSSKARRAGAVIAGYCTHVDLHPTELERLEEVITVRPLVFLAWSLATGRLGAGDVAARVADIEVAAVAIAEQVSRTLGA